MKKLLGLACAALFAATSVFAAGPAAFVPNFSLTSPDGDLRVEISAREGDGIVYSVTHAGDEMIASSEIAMQIEGAPSFGVNPRLAGSSTRTVDNTFAAAVYKRAQVRDNFNELTLKFKDNYNVIFRAYDDGVAYRFQYTGGKTITVRRERADFNFPADAAAVIPYVSMGTDGDFESQFRNSFESTYTRARLSEWNEGRLAFLPLVVEGPGGKKVCITEAELLNYPGMYLWTDGAEPSLTGVFAPVPSATEQGGHNNLQMIVTAREKYIARVKGPAIFPWRIVVVSESDAELADSDMVYKISTPATGDFSWVKPGKVAWDWWNNWNLFDVDFAAGVNNDTYKYYIDFAASKGIEYVILDEGWAVNMQADLMQVVPEIDLLMLVSYAASKGVEIILWAGYWAFDRDMENVCKTYSAMGVKGFKVDFMDRDDQQMVDFHRRAAQMAVKYKMLIDFHGSYKPTGLQRTYPNVINFEGVYGQEQVKWEPRYNQVAYDVTIPFVRQVAGPMDYTQGAMRNATRDNHRIVYSEPMSQGTRCHQLAEYVVFESPLNMLCDSPSNYLMEEECTAFIAEIPTVWDETVVLDGALGEWVAIARRSGDVWWVGALTDWNPRTVTLDLSLLGAGESSAEVYRDGANADRAAHDYKKETAGIPADGRLTITMAPGGGWAAKISPAAADTSTVDAATE